MGAVLSCSTVRGRGYSHLKMIEGTNMLSSSPVCATSKEEFVSGVKLPEGSPSPQGEPIRVFATPSQDRILAELAAHRTWSSGH